MMENHLEQPLAASAARANPDGNIGISVVIPLYNKAEYIGACIDSVLAQDYTPYEIIVVDDGSTDNGPALVAARQDPRIKLIRQPNAGPSVARNTGVAATQCELVAFLDADDSWFPAHLYHLAKLMRHHPECVLFANREQPASSTFTAINTPDSKEEVHALSSYLVNLLDGNDPAGSSTVLVRKTIFNKTGGFPPGHHHGEDHALWLKLALEGPVATSSYIGAMIRQTPNSLSSRVVTQPDACTLLIDSMIAAGTGLGSDLDCLLMELKHKYAIAHAINALLNDELKVARRFLKTSDSTRRYRIKWLILAFLSALSGYPRRSLIGIWKRYRGLS